MSRRRQSQSQVPIDLVPERQSYRLSDTARRQWGVVVIMNSARRHIARSLLILAAFAACGIAPAGHSASSAASEGRPLTPGEELAGIRPEGRLRKLHLVRPDLIPYPIAYEVYC